MKPSCAAYLSVLWIEQRAEAVQVTNSDNDVVSVEGECRRLERELLCLACACIDCRICTGTRRRRWGRAISQLSASQLVASPGVQSSAGLQVPDAHQTVFVRDEGARSVCEHAACLRRTLPCTWMPWMPWMPWMHTSYTCNSYLFQRDLS